MHERDIETLNRVMSGSMYYPPESCDPMARCKTVFDRYCWLLGELHAGNEFNKDQLWKWLREAEMARDLLDK